MMSGKIRRMLSALQPTLAALVIIIVGFSCSGFKVVPHHPIAHYVGQKLFVMDGKKAFFHSHRSSFSLPLQNNARRDEIDVVRSCEVKSNPVMKQDIHDDIMVVAKDERCVNSVTVQSSPRAAMIDEQIFKFNKAVIDTMHNFICFLYPIQGNDRDFARFFVFETIERVPYFAFLSVLHLQETFGVRDLDETMRTHYAEADNELHHLLIMEALGGNSNVIDRCLAQTLVSISCIHYHSY